MHYLIDRVLTSDHIIGSLSAAMLGDDRDSKHKYTKPNSAALSVAARTVWNSLQKTVNVLTVLFFFLNLPGEPKSHTFFNNDNVMLL